MTITRRSDVYHLLPMCPVHVQFRILLSDPECLLPWFLKFLYMPSWHVPFMTVFNIICKYTQFTLLFYSRRLKDLCIRINSSTINPVEIMWQALCFLWAKIRLTIIIILEKAKRLILVRNIRINNECFYLSYCGTAETRVYLLQITNHRCYVLCHFFFT